MAIPSPFCFESVVAAQVSPRAPSLASHHGDDQQASFVNGPIAERTFNSCWTWSSLVTCNLVLALFVNRPAAERTLSSCGTWCPGMTSFYVPPFSGLSKHKVLLGLVLAFLLYELTFHFDLSQRCMMLEESEEEDKEAVAFAGLIATMLCGWQANSGWQMPQDGLPCWDHWWLAGEIRTGLAEWSCLPPSGGHPFRCPGGHWWLVFYAPWGGHLYDMDEQLGTFDENLFEKRYFGIFVGNLTFILLVDFTIGMYTDFSDLGGDFIYLKAPSSLGGS